VPLAPDELDAVVARYLGRLRNELETPGPVSRLRERVAARCATVGSDVRVTLADGSLLVGRATGIDATGRLEVLSESGDLIVVAVGDVTHVRPVQ
jgi:BirA family biotin operon repressor/biotin-[acetyl-CoA-carboxylase] ligase